MSGDQPQLVYVGSYTEGAGGNGVGITVLARDTATGTLTRHGEPLALPSPSFLAWHPDGRHLYAANEPTGELTAIAVGPDGVLDSLGSQATGGAGPCHLTVHPGGGFVLCANYGSGSIAVLPIDAEGRLGPRTDLVQHAGSGPDPDRQEGPHAHNVQLDLDGRRVLAIDLGTDEVRCYDLDLATGELETGPVARPPAGTGPRHAAFHPAGRVYVSDELVSTVSVYRYASTTGALSLIDSVPATAGPVAASVRNYPSEITLSADGRFIYVGNRGADCVTVFAVEDDTLRAVADVPSGGQWPRHLTLIGEHLYVANQNSDSIGIFRVDPDSGVPEPAGAPVELPSPACIVAEPPRA